MIDQIVAVDAGIDLGIFLQGLHRRLDEKRHEAEADPVLFLEALPVLAAQFENPAQVRLVECGEHGGLLPHGHQALGDAPADGAHRLPGDPPLLFPGRRRRQPPPALFAGGAGFSVPAWRGGLPGCRRFGRGRRLFFSFSAFFSFSSFFPAAFSSFFSAGGFFSAFGAAPSSMRPMTVPTETVSPSPTAMAGPRRHQHSAPG